MKASCSALLLRTCIQIFLFPIYLLWYLGIWGPLCKKAFPYFMASVSVHYNTKMNVKKKELFSNLVDFASPARELTILEIGTGTGTNFQFYPTGCKVICTDSNPNFNKFIDKSLSQNPHVKLERCLVASAEDLHQIPDASMDVMVSTLVMCSVMSTAGVLREALRVLRTGGAFFFMEHVAGAPGSWNLFWQQVYDPTFNILFDGCHLTRETWKDLEKVGFSELKLCHVVAPLDWNPAKPHIIGYAVK